jgi:hypothetical protein
MLPLMIQPARHSRRPTPDERRFLDQIVFWRGIYAERGPQDSEPTISPHAAIAAAEQRMRALRVRDDQLRGRFAGG